jgi:hypothetical protein
MIHSVKNAEQQGAQLSAFRLQRKAGNSLKELPAVNGVLELSQNRDTKFRAFPGPQMRGTWGTQSGYGNRGFAADQKVNLDANWNWRGELTVDVMRPKLVGGLGSGTDCNCDWRSVMLGTLGIPSCARLAML